MIPGDADEEDGIRTVFRRLMDDERLYMARFDAPFPVEDDMDIPPEKRPDERLLELVEDEAERIEGTVDCVTAVEPVEKLGPYEHQRVHLYALMSRDADRDLVERVIETSRQRVMEALHE